MLVVKFGIKTSFVFNTYFGWILQWRRTGKTASVQRKSANQRSGQVQSQWYPTR